MSASTAAAPKARRPFRVGLPKQRTTTVKGVCAMTGLGATTVNALIRDNKLKSACIGRRRLVFVDSVDALLNGTAE